MPCRKQWQTTATWSIKQQHYMKILLTGASGYIGENLQQELLAKGHQVNSLTRKDPPAANRDGLQYFKWDPAKDEIDEHCADEAEAIINLAGAGIAQKPWSKKVRKEILKSRTDSVNLLYSLLRRNDKHRVRSFVSASATGYYGDQADQWLSEDHAAEDSFLGQTCLAWEQAVEQGKALGIRTVCLRSGLVLGKDGGILPKISALTEWGLGAALGNGRQWVPWIHLEDAVQMYCYALEHEGLQGPFNMVAPDPVTNLELTETIAKTLKRPLWLPHVPAVVLTGIMGKMSALVLNSTRASAERIESTGFTFKYPGIGQAIQTIYA